MTRLATEVKCAEQPNAQVGRKFASESEQDLSLKIASETSCNARVLMYSSCPELSGVTDERGSQETELSTHLIVVFYKRVQLNVAMLQHYNIGASDVDAHLPDCALMLVLKQDLSCPNVENNSPVRAFMCPLGNTSQKQQKV